MLREILASVRALLAPLMDDIHCLVHAPFLARVDALLQRSFRNYNHNAEG
jgi:hypothetical protein